MVYTISFHAQKRMDDRDITRPMIKAVIASGKQCLNDNGCIEYQIDDLVVVVDPEQLFIITVFFKDRRKKPSVWGPKKRQRAYKKEMKPTYIKGRGKINIKQQEQYRSMVHGL